MPKPSKRCKSCAKLKIQCNLERPRCEYCRATSRECEYPIPTNSRSSSKSSKPSKLSSALVVARFSQSHNLKAANLSATEWDLMNYFNHGCLHIVTLGVDSIEETWKEVPMLANSSPLLQSAILALSGLRTRVTDSDCNHNRGVLIRGMDTKGKSMADMLQLGRDTRPSKWVYQSDDEMVQLFTAHVNSCMRQLGTAVLNPSELDMQVIPAVTVLLYVFLGLNPLGMAPILVLDQQQPDFIRIARGMYASLSEMPRKIVEAYDVADEFEGCDDLPICSYLRDLHSSVEPRLQPIVEEINEYIYRTLMSRSPISVYRWALSMPRWFSDSFYTEDYGALRILNAYVSLNTIFGFYITELSNPWLDHIEWFRDYTRNRYGDWQYPYDAALYNALKLGGFAMRELLTIDPVALYTECQLHSSPSSSSDGISDFGDQDAFVRELLGLDTSRTTSPTPPATKRIC
ncbi:hypothetical protein DICA0_F41856 [Diutina catenulata]